jgi:site-specific DNA-methyltransferase (adenine-specific)
MIKEIFQLGGCTLYHGDCEEVIKTIPDNSVTLIHTDPPYIIHSDDNMGEMMEKKARKSYDKLIKADISDGFNVGVMFPEFIRVCKAVNFQLWCSKKQFIEYLILAYGKKWNWQDVHLFRNNALPNVRGKYQDHDYCVHLWKGRTLTGTYHQKRLDYHYTIGGTKEWNHPALKPLEPILNMIPIGSDEGDIVLDPYMGSGTTGEACLRTNRKFIGIEKDSEFFNMACERIRKVYNEVKIDVS